jgi:hypothetical protein
MAGEPRPEQKPEGDDEEIHVIQIEDSAGGSDTSAPPPENTTEEPAE